MASWHPADGTHGGLAGAPDAYCYTCGQYCGGLDAAGNELVCNHCRALGLPPSDDGDADPGHDLRMPHDVRFEGWKSCPPNCPHLQWAARHGLTGAPDETVAPSAETAPADGSPLLWGGEQVPLT